MSSVVLFFNELFSSAEKRFPNAGELDLPPEKPYFIVKNILNFQFKNNIEILSVLYFHIVAEQIVHDSKISQLVLLEA